jgi:hypothetical protein
MLRSRSEYQDCLVNDAEISKLLILGSVISRFVNTCMLGQRRSPQVERFYYSDTVEGFLDTEDSSVIGTLATSNEFSLDATQRDAWVEQIRVLRVALVPYRQQGKVASRRFDTWASEGGCPCRIDFSRADTLLIAVTVHKSRITSV